MRSSIRMPGPSVSSRPLLGNRTSQVPPRTPGPAIGAFRGLFAVFAAVALASSLAACASRATHEATEAPSQSALRTSPASAAVSVVPVSRTESWWTERHAAILAAVRAGGHRTAFIGDSITQGWELPGKSVWAEKLSALKPVNCGISADRTQHVLYRLDDGLLDALAASNNEISAVVLLIGTNNTSPPANSAEDIALGIETILARLNATLPNARVVLMSVFPRGQWHNARRDVIGDVNQRLRTIADRAPERITLVDLTSAYLLPSGELPARLMPDYLHLSEDGYRIWADAVLGALSGK